MLAAAVVLAFAGSVGATASTTTAASPHFLMPWLCLERCGGNATSIAANVKQVQDNTGTLFTAAAFELFNLGPNGALVKNNLTNVLPT